VLTPLTRYFALSPVVPMVLGRDARLQLVHETDAVGVLEHLAVGDFSGTVNVAGDGAITLAQAIHRAGRIPLPVPSLSLDGLSRVMATVRMGGFSPGQVKLLSAGRVLDTTRLRERVGYLPRFTTIEAFDDFAASLRPALAPETVRRVEVRLAGALGARPLPAMAEMAALATPSGGSVAVVDDAGAGGDAAEPAAAGADFPDNGDGQNVGRPRLVGITGDGTGAPRRRRTR
jgi:UDP-glucose 4-epimerase